MLLAQAATGDASEILRALTSTPEREAGSIISTARSALSLWLDPRVASETATSAGNRLDLDALLQTSGTLSLVAPAEDAERCRLLFSALLSSLLRKATERARRLGGVLEPRLLLALDLRGACGGRLTGLHRRPFQQLISRRIRGNIGPGGCEG